MSNHPGLLFVDQEALERLQCTKCLMLLNDPVQPSCGHHLCKCCADEILQNICPPRCPHNDCGEEFIKIEVDGVYYFSDRFVKREIQTLKVQCRSCNWRGIFNEGRSHFKDCKDSCPFCGEKVSRYDLDKHTGSCEEYLSNFKHVSPAQQKADGKKFTSSNKHTYEEDFSSNFEHELSYAQQESIASVESTLDRLSRKLQTIHKQIIVLHDRVTKIQKQIHSEAENRDFRATLIANASYSGYCVWKIPELSQRKADGASGKHTSIFSLPFYSGRYGYKMCLRLYIMGDGIGKGTHLSLFFVMMRGEFDNILQWPFTHKVTFKLINQAGGRDIVETFQPNPQSSAFQKPKSDMNIASGCPQFVSHKELEKGGFIVDDTIFIKGMIDTEAIVHP